MAELKCGVENCTYNKGHLCSKGDIMIGGKHATSSDETRCDSFSEMRVGGDVFKSSLDHPCKTISIDCEASECTYNNNYKCVAEHVDITGCGASNCKETCCSTFAEK